MEDALENFNRREVFRKKIAALRNFAETLDEFEDWAPLELISKFLERFEERKEEGHYLDSLLDKYHIDYTQWSHRTGWVKNQIMARNNGEGSQELYFDFYELEKQRIENWKVGLAPSSILSTDISTCRRERCSLARRQDNVSGNGDRFCGICDYFFYIPVFDFYVIFFVSYRKTKKNVELLSMRI